MNKSILTDGSGRAQLISSSKKASRKPLQDSPKEDYILCTPCEQYLSKLETSYATDIYHRLQAGRYGEFEEYNTLLDQTKIYGRASHHQLDHNMLWASIFWRVSISNHSLYCNSTLDHRREEALRQMLVAHQNAEQVNNPDGIYFLILSTPKGLNDSRNFITSLYDTSTASLVSNNTIALMGDLSHWIPFASTENKCTPNQQFRIILFPRENFERFQQGLYKHLADLRINGTDFSSE